MAVTTTEGPLLVLAGAGTGKTRVIAYRVAHLLQKGVPARAVLAVTFTNKAAREMRERVGGLVDRAGIKDLTVSTFHAFGLRVLRESGNAIGVPSGFTICDESDQWSLARAALREVRLAGVEAGPADALRAIGLWKGAGVTPEEAADRAADEREELFAACYRRYEEALRSRKVADFDDLIFLPVRLLRECPEILDRYRKRFRHLLVDEYQDTSLLQYRLVQALAGPGGNVCVVGDDDQSIYSFRGADAGKILRFEQDFPGARVVTLTENYRSTGAILNLANAVIRINAGRREKDLRATCGAGRPIRLATLADERAEADHAAALFLELREREKVAWGDCAVLFRTAAQARPFEEKLRLRRIPYLLVGGRSFFDRAEVRDFMAYLKAAVNPDDEGAVLRIVNFPPRGFGKASIEVLDRLAKERGGSIGAALEVAADCPDLPGRTREGAAGLVAALRRLRDGAAAGESARAAEALLEETGFRAGVRMAYPDPLEAESRIEAVEEVLESLRHFERERRGGLEGFLSSLALEDERPEEKETKDRVALMTLHAAKGLEFRHVVLAGVEDGLLPHHRSVAEDGNALEEERRLFYVGITRARETLMLTRARRRSARGGPRMTEPSRFLGEVPDGLMLRDDDRPATPEEAAEAVARLREKLGWPRA